jgi:hypothetical protein
MMVNVTNQHVDQRPRADRGSAGSANPAGGRIAHVLDRQDVCAPQVLELLNQILDWVFVEPGFTHEIILLEAGQGSGIVPGDT